MKDDIDKQFIAETLCALLGKIHVPTRQDLQKREILESYLSKQKKRKGANT